jgi:hypothetical protein
LISETPDELVARAGSCLDVECATETGQTITHALNGQDGILRINQTPTGLSIFLNGRTVPDEVMRMVLQSATVNGFRVRGADLAEVFRALEEVPS